MRWNNWLYVVLYTASCVRYIFVLVGKLIIWKTRLPLEFGYSLFNEDSPFCNTISARYYKDGSEILIDQSKESKNPRKLTPRECARIQGFPDEYLVNAVSDVQIYKQFGNSVSVPVIRSIAQLILEVIKNG